MHALLISSLLLIPTQADGKGKKKKQGSAPAARKNSDEPEKINPRGRFNGDIIDQRATFFIWLDGDEWHIRSGSGGRLSTFNATIKIHKGKLKSYVPMGLEKKGKAADSYAVSKDKSVLTFTIHTGGAADGFNIKVDGDDAELEFDLAVNGKKEPSRVAIGPNKRRPSQMPFRLVNNPPPSNEKPKAPQPKKKKKKAA